MNILEDRRSELVSRSKRAKQERDGKTRYQKRVKSRVVSSNRQYNEIDMNKLFKQGILDLTIHVIGETDNYDVKIKFGGFLDNLHDYLKRTEVFDLRSVARALINSFNREDVYVHCNCPDARYRQSYFQTVNKINSGEPELRPSKITNPDDKLGAGCKHVMLVLANTSWIIKVASVIVNYVKYMENHKQDLYSRVIYPAIYEREYTEPVQQSMFDKEEEQDVDKANEFARKKTQFKPGNETRFKKQDKDLEGQEEIELDDNEEIQ